MFMEKKLKNNFIFKNKTIRDAFVLLNKNARRCLIVVDKNNKLLGTLTDGDIRKYLLGVGIFYLHIEKGNAKLHTIIKFSNFIKLFANFEQYYQNCFDSFKKL